MKISRRHPDSKQVKVITRLPNSALLQCADCVRQWILHRERTIQWKCAKCGVNLYYLALGDQWE